ncbi:MAG TPA: penicillin-binding protein 2 [Nitrospirota bacterium]
MKYRSIYGGGGENTGDIKRRLWILAFFVAVFFIAIILRLWYLQVVKGSYYRELSESNRIRIANIRPPRGVIYDRNGIPLVTNTPSYTVTFTPEDAKKSPEVTGKLATILGMREEDLQALIRAEKNRNPYQPIRVRENASFSEVSMVEARRDELPGVIVQVELRRCYPYGEFAAHAFGYIGKITEDQQKMQEYEGLPSDFLVGQYGIEKAYDKTIRGEPGRRGIEVDAMGRQIRTVYTVEPVAGEDLLSTLDFKAQKAADEALGEKAGAIVALDPQNGDVLAMASRPGFDPNIFPIGLTGPEWKYLTQDPSHPLNNRALQGTFPPGSTFKLAMALAGLETGMATLDNTVNCTGGYPFGGRVFHCWQKKGHHTIALHKAIVESCDVYFYNLGNRMGIDNIAKYASYLGLGMQTGIGLKEKAGLVPSSKWKKEVRHEDWYAGETISCSIGQGYVNVSPIQLARMTGTIANGGVLYQPQIVRGIRHRDGSMMMFPTVTLWKAPVKPENLQIVKDGMQGVVEEPGGTGHAAKSEYYSVGGKSGTAQVIGMEKGNGRSGSKETHDHAWFVAVAPMDNPKIAVCVLVEHGGHGGSAAAPLAKKVIDAYMRMDEESLKEKAALANRTSASAKALANMTSARAKAALANRTGAKAKALANRTSIKAKTLKPVTTIVKKKPQVKKQKPPEKPAEKPKKKPAEAAAADSGNEALKPEAELPPVEDNTENR